jgi:hypothetical protein
MAKMLDLRRSEARTVAGMLKLPQEIPFLNIKSSPPNLRPPERRYVQADTSFKLSIIALST